MTVPRLEIARSQIEAARHYTLALLDEIPQHLWFEQPPGCQTHVAWQVGHLAMAEYGLALFRQRGRTGEDAQLMSSAFRKKYSRGSQVDPDPAGQPAAAELLDTLDRVHQQALRELGPDYPPDRLDEQVDAPYAAFPTKFGALLFCAHHEMLHAGQLGLLRRLLGMPPVR